MYTKQSLEKLRDKIDLLDVLSSHIELKRIGGSHKALCPFHQEKTPSFLVQRGDTHYHCFGCGAHGDALQFLMNYLNLSFMEAVESLAERYGVALEEEEQKSKNGVDKTRLREVLSEASHFFHAYLLYSEEGRNALSYLFKREITLDFIQKFEIGYAPANNAVFFKAMRQMKWPTEILEATGLLHANGSPFFKSRITFPIRDVFGYTIGFSARKIEEATFGGKYINTPETPLFKKSKMLFGLNYSRKRIAKEKKAILVEGQIDCLRLLDVGLNFTVSALGTAFGEGHVAEIAKLGTRLVYLLFDGDEAGKTAASKVGDLFQKKGLSVKVVSLPNGVDPDSYLKQNGVEKLIQALEKAEDYLSFQIRFLSQNRDMESPAEKAAVVRTMKAMIESWEEPVLVHESMKKLAALIHVPEETIGIGSKPFFFVKKHDSLPLASIDPDRILELDFLRWLVIMGEKEEEFRKVAAANLSESHFFIEPCRKFFGHLLTTTQRDYLSLAADTENSALLDEILKKKINPAKAKEQFLMTIQKLLDRKWMQMTEEIKIQIHSGKKSESEIFALAKEFDELKKQRPEAKWQFSNT